MDSAWDARSSQLQLGWIKNSHGMKVDLL